MIIRQQHGNENAQHFNLVDESCMALTLRKVNPRKATGYDHIPGTIVRISHQVLSFLNTCLINTAISVNAFPSDMKLAEISPGYQTDANLIKRNYRLVSVLRQLWTINNSDISWINSINCWVLFEKDITVKVYYWNLPLTRILLLVCLMDLFKGLDYLPRSLLIAKLPAYGADWSACEFIESPLAAF